MSKRIIYTPEEKKILTFLVMKNEDIIESRKCDPLTVVQKKECWDEITYEFNRHGECTTRTSSQLRKAWDNLKTRRKSELSAEKRARLKSPEVIIEEQNEETSAEAQQSTEDIGSRPSTMEDLAAPAPTQKTKGGSNMKTDGESLRILRNELLFKHEQELHERKMEESRIRIEILEQEKQQAKELFEEKLKNEANAERRNERESRLRRLLLQRQIRQEKLLFQKRIEMLQSKRK